MSTPHSTQEIHHRKRGVEPIYWFFLVPVLIVFTVFITYPAIEGFVMSFTNSIGFGTYEWIGFNNYIALLQDENIVSSYAFTFLFALTTVILVNVIAFFLALGLTSKIKLTNPLRAIFVIPMVISAIIYSYVFKFLFNNTLSQLGAAIGNETLAGGVLANENWAWLAIVVVATWGSIPSAMLIYIAGFMTVPGEVYEACAIDGSSPAQTLWHITLPLVAGYVGINVIVGFKDYLGIYDQIVALTDGGPGVATRSVAFTILKGFEGGDYAYQMANAAVFFIITIIIALVQLRVTQGRTNAAS